MGPIVLAIDDDRSSQILMRAHLEDEQFCSQFVDKSNGIDALSYLNDIAQNSNQQIFPDIVLLDIHMPEMSGWGFLEEITPLLKSLGIKALIILLSATNTAEDVELAVKHTAVFDITTKPITNEYLDSLKNKTEPRKFFLDECKCA